MEALSLAVNLLALAAALGMLVVVLRTNRQ